MTTSPVTVTGVDYVAIPTADFDRAFPFYADVLGLPFVKRWGAMPAAELQAGNLTLAIMQMDAFGQEFRRTTAPIALQVADVDAARAALEAQGVAFHGQFDSGTCHQAVFSDPDGNTLVLHHKYAADR